ncbi:hypothetical protein TruAng_005772 [Truncatella angustata]|nr:hypothetical protein TruAng_005772 [Truncatella angustata]
MPPKKQTKAGEDAPIGGTTLSEPETQLIVAIFESSSKGDWVNNVDWQKVTDTLGATNIKATKERFRAMVAKHGFFRTEISEGKDAAAATPKKTAKAKTPGSRKKKAEPTDDDMGETPTKKVKTSVDANADADMASLNGDGLSMLDGGDI